MLECLFVPHAVGLEHEDLLALHVSEDHVLIEPVACPKKFAYSEK